MTNDSRRQPGSDVGGSASGGEAAGGAPEATDRYGLANLAIVFNTIAGTLVDLGRDLSGLNGSSLVDRCLALDRVLKRTQAAIGETRKYLNNCVMEAMARGNARE